MREGKWLFALVTVVNLLLRRERELGLVSYVGLVGQQGPWGVMLECSTGYCLKQEFTHGWLCGGCLSHIIAHPTPLTHSLTASSRTGEKPLVGGAKLERETSLVWNLSVQVTG